MEFERGEGSKECGIFEEKRNGMNVCQGRGVRKSGVQQPLISLGQAPAGCPIEVYAS